MFISPSKLSRMSLAFCLSAGTAAQAASPNQYATAQMVPYANFTTEGNLTAVGLLARFDGTVRWAFFDSQGNRRASNSFPIKADELKGFFWNATTAGGNSLAGQPGFLLFAHDWNGDGQINSTDGSFNMGANAFYILPPGDVAYVPTVDVDFTNLGNPDAATWTNSPVASLPSARRASTGDTVDSQFLIDGASGGDDTDIVIWTARKMAANQSMTLNDGAGTSKPSTVQFLANNLNVIDPETDAQVTSGFFGDGYLRWPVLNAADSGPVDVFVFSIVSSPLFGAVQTLMPNF